MDQRYAWMRTAIAALFCAAASLTFAEPKMPQVVDTQDIRDVRVATLKQRSADLDEAIAATNEKAALLEQQLAELKATLASTDATTASQGVVAGAVIRVAQMGTIVVTASKSESIPEQDVVLVERIILDQHTPSLAKYWSHKDTAFKKENPWPQFWKETSRLSNIPHTDSAWRKVRAGTAITIPATSIFVAAQNGSTPPRAIALDDPQADNGLLVLNMKAVAVTAREKELAADVATLQRELVRKNLYNTLLLVVLSVLFLLLFFRRTTRENCNSVLPERIPPKLGDPSRLDRPTAKE